MNKLVTTAIVGTGQQATTDLSTGTAVDALTKQLPTEQPERSLLLAAGAWALYQQAGYTVQVPRVPQQPAPAEEKDVCSSKVAQIISGLLQGRHDILLSEALERLAGATTLTIRTLAKSTRLWHKPQASAIGSPLRSWSERALAGPILFGMELGYIDR